MTKRADEKFERKDRDLYPTPIEAVFPLLPLLPAKTTFIEPCAGDGRLVMHLEKYGHKCVHASDIEPQAENIMGRPNDRLEKADCLFFDYQFPPAAMIITNPPWKRNADGTGPLHEMITKFRLQAPTWLLIDADWAYTDQARDFMKYCQIMKVVGRISWQGNGVAGFDNCCWYLFGHRRADTIFITK